MRRRATASTWSPFRRAGLAVALALSLGGAEAGAQQATLRAEATARQVGVEDQFQLVVTLEGQSVELREEIAMPTLENLRVVAGPSVSTQISLVNGRMSQAKRYTFLLQPTAVGAAVIGPVRAVLSDGARTTEPITVDVVPGSVLPQRRPAAGPPFGDAQEDPFEAIFGRRQAGPQAKLAVEATASRTRLFVGESLLLTYSLLTQAAVAGLDFAEAPRFPGFWSEQLPQDEQPGRGEAVVSNGEQFTRFTVYRKLLIPTKAGTLTIPAATFKINVPRRVGLFVDPLPGAVTTVTRATQPIEVVVDPPSTEEPFSGAVGQFRTAASLDHEVIDLGEAVTYRFRVEGRGNLKWVEKGPELPLQDVKIYPPQTVEDFSISPAGLSGSKTWEFVVVPQTAGVLRFPSLDFAYFDPSSKRVVNARSVPLELQVRGGAPVRAATARVTAAAAAADGTRHPLRGDLDRPRLALPRLGGGGVAAILCAVALGHAVLWGLPLLLARGQRGGPAGSSRSVRSTLSALRRAGRGGMTKEAAAVLIEEALTGVFGGIDERPAVADDERTATVRQILRDVRFIRFAPQLGDYSEKIGEIAARATAAVKRWA